jgi:hypothetical protein
MGYIAYNSMLVGVDKIYKNYLIIYHNVFIFLYFFFCLFVIVDSKIIHQKLYKMFYDYNKH